MAAFSVALARLSGLDRQHSQLELNHLEPQASKLKDIISSTEFYSFYIRNWLDIGERQFLKFRKR
jgi:DNA gyrase/topoisomerase IV subunit A